jgi:hypothetical protein
MHLKRNIGACGGDLGDCHMSQSPGCVCVCVCVYIYICMRGGPRRLSHMSQSPGLSLNAYVCSHLYTSQQLTGTKVISYWYKSTC